MIVQCDQCQARFKIPDEKVSDKVRVRCPKCQHTFRLQPQASPEADPFARFAPQGPPATPAPKFDPFAGLDLGTSAPPAAEDDDVFAMKTRVASSPTPAPAEPPPMPQVARPSPELARPLPRPQSPAAAPSGVDADPDILDDDAAFGDDFTSVGRAATPAPELLADVPPPSPEPASSVNQAELDDGEPSRAPEAEENWRSTLFEMPEPAPKPPPTPTPKPPPRTSRPLPARSPRPVRRPSGRPENVGLAPPQGPLRKVVGALVNVVVAAVLLLFSAAAGVVYLNEGKLDASVFSPERLRALFAAPRDLVAVDVSNGLYDTQLGRAVFFVRGEVENRSPRPGKVKVRAELLEDGQLVRAAEGFAGAIATPEELHAIGSASDVEALHARLARSAAEIRPGARSPFLLAFYEYPPDLGGLRLRLVVTPAEGAHTAER